MNTRVMTWTLLLLAAGPLSAADGLDVSTGLWEVTYTTAMNGMMMPQSMLDSMTPEQREKFTASMQKRAAAGPQTRTVKSCVTAKDLKEGAFQGENDANCKQTVVAQTKNKQEAMIQCSGAESRTGHMKIEASDRNHMTGTMDMSAGNGKVNMQLAGKWLNASCAGANH
jgi:Protein of unknown function (DUF3617)